MERSLAEQARALVASARALLSELVEEGVQEIPKLKASPGQAEPGRAVRIAARAAAIETAIREAAPDDLVLVAGKGHEDYQQIGSARHPFSDRVQVQSVLRRLGA